MPCPKTPFPRAALSKKFVRQVKRARNKLGWSQGRLAAEVGVARKTITRLECRQTSASVHLVRALMRNEVLGAHLSSIKGWELEPDRMPRGFLARVARLACGKSQRTVAAEVGSSIASLSAFERGLLTPKAFTGCRPCDDDDDVSDPYAQALGFGDAGDMKAYIEADDPVPWLERIAEAHGRPLPAAALLPIPRIPVLDDGPLLPDFLLD